MSAPLLSASQSALPTPIKRQAVLELRDVTKRFGDSIVVNDISFKVYDREFLFLIGPSGCGKTTTLRLIGGYETASAGSIFIRGRSMTNVPLERRNIGMVFQSYALFPHMTVRQNVAFGLRTRRVPRRQCLERVADALELVKLTDYGDHYPAQLSGGQRQRVALARVIVYEPDILLLDEPLANLDKRLRDVMRIELRRLQEKVGITTVYVTHDQEEALAMADRIAVMDGGDVLQIGSPRDIYNQPHKSFVGTFLGESSVFCGDVVSAAGSLGQVEISDGVRIGFRHAGDLGVGDRVSVSIRPERVRLDLRRPVHNENVFAGKIEFASYLGASVVYLIRLDDNDALIRASEPLPDGLPRFEEGQSVFAWWAVEQAVCLKIPG